MQVDCSSKMIARTSVIFAVLALGYVECSDVVHGKIFGGQNATDGGHPFMASVRYLVPNSHVCGGSVIAKRTILTAAQCLFQTTVANTAVVVGTNVWNTGGTRYQVASFKMHPEFNQDTVKSDIGLVIVNRDIDYTPRVQPITYSPDPVGAAVDVYIIGWGYVKEEGPFSPNLKYLTSKTISNADCKSRLGEFGSFLFDTSLCIQNPRGQSVCDGDSGGPIVANNKVVAVVSWIATCGSGSPAVNTRVGSYNTWITNNKV